MNQQATTVMHGVDHATYYQVLCWRLQYLLQLYCINLQKLCTITGLAPKELLERGLAKPFTRDVKTVDIELAFINIRHLRALNAQGIAIAYMFKGKLGVISDVLINPVNVQARFKAEIQRLQTKEKDVFDALHVKNYEADDFELFDLCTLALSGFDIEYIVMGTRKPTTLPTLLDRSFIEYGPNEVAA